MKRINLAFAVHNHQPIGNFDTVFEEAYQFSYRPFLETLSRFPSIKFTQHYTGALLEWLERNHPEMIETLRGMVNRGQLELLTGAYYEAIVCIIPEQDCIGQINKLTEKIQNVFDYTPKGMWLAERVWEQTLVGPLARAGVEFVVVDDTHFKHAGLRDEQLLGYYVTEDQGSSLDVVPIDKMLRYTVPFRSVEETLHYLQSVASDKGTRVVVHADDGEKFGVWPKTYKHVYEDRWLESFCTMLDHNRAWINTMHLGEVVHTFAPEGRIYLPTASYSEMMKWSLNPTAFVGLERFENDLKQANLFEENAMFVHGGYWRNFLSKYPEANHMHKKMMRVARRVHSVNGKRNVPPEILDHLWAGQCNDPYWHGVFGGLYLPNLRFPVYQSLLKAERALDKIDNLPLVRVEETDFDCDGAGEILVESDIMNLYFKPSLGGSLVELDYKPAAFNLLDITSRREEGYHRRLMAQSDEFKLKTTIHEGVLAKEEGLEKHLHFDWYRHASLVDHFLGEGTTLESFARCRYLELGDFVNQAYDAAVKEVRGMADLTLARNGALWYGEKAHRLSVVKNVQFAGRKAEFTAAYTLTNMEARPAEVWFGIEFNVGLMAGDAHDRYYDIEGRYLRNKTLRSTGEETGVRSVRLVDEWLGIETEITFDKPATIWRFPIETVSLSEAGFERVYQSSVILALWRLNLSREFSIIASQSVQQI
jgi:hypothetical protein